MQRRKWTKIAICLAVTCPPKTGPGNMLELGRRKGERWPRGDIGRSR